MTKQILVTGASGYLGQAIAQRLLRAGFTVDGLVRSDDAARAVAAQGLGIVRGSLDDVERLDLAGYDGIIDTATADHAPSTSAFLDTLAGSGRTYIRTSGTGVYTDLGAGAESPVVYTEADSFVPAAVIATRVESDDRVVRAAERDIRTIVIRPSMVYGDGGSEQLPHMLRYALAHGRAVYAGAGANRWSNVYLYDLAELYLLAYQYAPAGSLYNVAGGELSMAEISDAIARLLGQGRAHSVPVEEARAALGARWVDVALASNSRVDSRRAREELGWEVSGPSLMAELESGSYRRIWASKGDPHDHATIQSAPRS
ncbi:MAG TPA: NAD-dependent epimerase/dehydratase family protein [Naasia sp.]|jgi:nucleoside-diphosphate-sugar epimerase